MACTMLLEGRSLSSALLVHIVVVAYDTINFLYVRYITADKAYLTPARPY